MKKPLICLAAALTLCVIVVLGLGVVRPKLVSHVSTSVARINLNGLPRLKIRKSKDCDNFVLDAWMMQIRKSPGTQPHRTGKAPSESRLALGTGPAIREENPEAAAPAALSSDDLESTTVRGDHGGPPQL